MHKSKSENSKNFWKILRPDITKSRRGYSFCECKCGKIKSVYTYSIHRGVSTSCGCRRDQLASIRSRKHGMSHSSEYSSWNSMRERCYRKTVINYHNYGGRGIRVCARWKNSFIHFFEDMGQKPFSCSSIERRNNNGNYEPENCYWSTPKEQARNTRHNRFLTHNGKTLCVKDWGAVVGLSYATICTRLDRWNWSVSDALTIKRYGRRGHKRKHIQ